MQSRPRVALAAVTVTALIVIASCDDDPSDTTVTTTAGATTATTGGTAPVTSASTATDSSPSSPPESSTPAEVAVPTITWAACPEAPQGGASTEGLQCATAKVPVDYDDPGAGSF